MQLTENELRVLAMVATGLKDETIADNISYSVVTVRGHLRSIYEKLNLGKAVNKRVSAVLWYIERNSNDQQTN